MLMWFTQRHVRAVVVLVGECRSCFCCISVYRFGVENVRVETRETTGKGDVQIEINAVASLRDWAHFTQGLLVYRPVASATAGYIPGWNTDRALSVLCRCRK